MPPVPARRYLGSVDAAVIVDERGIFISGWLSGVREGDRVELVGPGGESAPIDLAYRYRRPDAIAAVAASARGDLHGFACLAALPPGPLQRPGLRLEIEAGDGGAGIIEIPDAVPDPAEGRAHVLKVLELGRPNPEFLARHAYPAIERLTARLESSLGVSEVIDQGRMAADPAVSIIVPIYGRTDLLTPQIALMSGDPEMRHAELILVLDSPELADELIALTHHLQRLYRQPMRVVIMRRNSGFGYANNAGARHAGAPMLLLLNSDVFPASRGWLSALAKEHRAGEVVATGAKLLYEDGSLQHAGMYFERDGVSGQWQNLHYFKGMPGNLPAAGVSRRVPALTAACLLVARDAFDAVGGFDPSYVLGDYEDSDLCMRLQSAGGECRYVAGAELHHLERQSFEHAPSSPIGAGRVVYNQWLFTHKWDDAVEELMTQFAIPSAPPAAPRAEPVG